MQDLEKFKNEMNLSGKNVYVGHRYVPKIFGDWDNTQIYEPLTIVTYEGNSFTSRQYVPTGVAINNEEYWVSTGNYNAQVELYRQEVSNVKKDIASKADSAYVNDIIEKNKQDSISLSSFGIDETGIEYVDDIFEQAITYAKLNGIKEIIGSRNATYKLMNPVNVPSNLVLNLNGAYINSDVDVEYTGSFEMKGTLESTLYPLNNDVLENTNSIELLDGLNIQKGDYVLITQSYVENTDSKYKHTRELLHVEEVVNNTMVLSQAITHNYLVENNATIQKAYPIVNSSVVDFNVNHGGTLKRTHSLLMELTDKCSAYNLSSLNGGGKGVEVIDSINFDISDVYVSDRTNVTAGHGYGVMVSSSGFGTVNKVRGYKTRHTVDLSKGAYHNNITDCFGFKNETATFSFHGQNCKYNIFDKCHSQGGLYGFAIGNSSFAYDEFNTISNSTASNATNTGFFTGIGSKSNKFISCIGYNSQNNFAVTSGSKTSLIGCESVNSTNKAVGINNHENITITDLKISGLNQRGLSIENSNKIQLSNITIEGENTEVSDSSLMIYNCKDLTANNILIDVNSVFGSLMVISTQSENINIDNAILKGTSPRYAFEIVGDSKNIKLTNSLINAEVGIDSVRLGVSSSDALTNIDINNSIIITPNSDTTKRAIRSWASRVRINNSELQGYSSFSKDDITIIRGNVIYGTLDIRATKGVVYTENVGVYNTVELGAHDGVNIIRINNIENFSE